MQAGYIKFIVYFMKEVRSSVVALCGPSGVGKGYTKNRLLAQFSGMYAEPVVVTTRPVRADDIGAAGRRAGVPDAEYQKLVSSGAIILDHRPFREPTTPRYGFDAESTFQPKPLLTEVHSTIIEDFSKIFADRRVFVVGFLAAKEMLRENVNLRDDSTNDIDTRIRMGQLEQEEILQAYDNGLITRLYGINELNRDTQQKSAIDEIQKFVNEG